MARRNQPSAPATTLSRGRLASWLHSADARIAFAVAAVALLLRLTYLHQSRSVVFFDSLIVDAKAYDAWAQRIAAGDWLGGGTTDVFYQAPLYPYFLAVLYALFGRDLYWVRLIQMLIGSASCAFLALAAMRFLSRPAGLISGLLLALYGPAIFFDGLIQKSVLDSFFITLLLWLLARRQTIDAPVHDSFIPPAESRPSGRASSALAWAAIGAVMGLLTLTRENAVVFAPAILFWLLLRFRHRPVTTRLAWSASFIAGMFAILLPVGLRNLAVGGEFALTTSQAGPNFYIGNNPKAAGIYIPLRPNRADPSFERVDATDLAEEALGRKLTPGEVSRYWLGRSWDFIRSQPADWLRQMLRKLALTINWYEVTDAEDYYYYQLYCPLLAALDPVANMGVLLPVAIVGVVLTGHRRRDLWLLYLLSATIIAAVALFYVFARYRFPLVPLLLIFAAAALVESARRLAALLPSKSPRAGAWRSPLFALVASAAAAWASNVTFPQLHREGQFGPAHVNAGYALVALGRLEQAVAHFREGVRRSPNFTPGYYYLGKTLFRLGRSDDALRVLEAGRRVDPDEPKILTQLAIVVESRGLLDAARELLDRAIVLNPRDPEPHFRLGTVLLKQRQWPPAIASLRRANEIDPSNADYAIEFAWALSVCPIDELRDGPRAVDLAEKAILFVELDELRSKPTASAPSSAIVEDAVSRSLDFRALDVLSAAYAECDRWDDARRVARHAHHAATADSSQRAEIEARLRLFEQKKPHRQP